MSHSTMHPRESFEQALRGLEDDIVRMGTMAGALIHRAIEALQARDAGEADAVIADDTRVDALHLEIEQRVIALLATQQPMARDLRELTSTMAISIDLERMADHAEGIGKAIKRLIKEPPLKPVVDIPRIEQIVQGMLQDALDAFVRRDVALAESLAAKDDMVDDLRSQVFRELLADMVKDPQTTSRALELILVAQHLERAADHITNVAERVIYLVTGEMRELNV
ncbi:MAG TPA: phosphate signaling complex protein PhoU [bacterium]|nr:phosphate signaling complex protein PhoU [bacterium]